MTVPDEVYQAARVRAAQQGRSVSALVTEFLADLVERDARFERLQALQDQVLDRIGEFHAAGRMSRGEIHSRAVR